MFLHARGILGSNWVYDVVASMWRVVIDIFFREIRSRGAWKIPRQNEGAVIFVVGPHHNQVSRHQARGGDDDSLTCVAVGSPQDG
jgi:glycerol-3-phosphate O-acyltransferase/dihydroxyacetone phosphate acyltransferase